MVFLYVLFMHGKKFLSIGSEGTPPRYPKEKEPYFVTIEPSSSYQSTLSNMSNSLDLQRRNIIEKNSRKQEVEEILSVLSKIDSQSRDTELEQINDLFCTELEGEDTKTDNSVEAQDIFSAVLESISDTRAKLLRIDEQKGIDVKKLIQELDHITFTLAKNQEIGLNSNNNSVTDAGDCKVFKPVRDKIDIVQEANGGASQPFTNTVIEKDSTAEIGQDQKTLFNAMLHFSQQMNELVDRVVTDGNSSKSETTLSMSKISSDREANSIQQDDSLSTVEDYPLEDSFTGNISLETADCQDWNRYVKLKQRLNLNVEKKGDDDSTKHSPKLIDQNSAQNPMTKLIDQLSPKQFGAKSFIHDKVKKKRSFFSYQRKSSKAM
mmetsp:Transcript_68/g.170  ORF Transcript_68/g.170 Transcript_68/m.170 type:complete len:378 (-) Transcript_68:279-1412(-)